MGQILLVMPSEYTLVDVDTLYQQTSVDSSQLQQASDSNMLIDLNDNLRIGGYITNNQNVTEVFTAPDGTFYLRIEG